MGVGRGVSPYELAFYDAEPQQSRGMFREALDPVLSGLSKGEVISQESCFSPQAVRLHMQPLQRPYPPLLYPTDNADSIKKLSQNLNKV